MKRSPEAVLGPDPRRSCVAHMSTSGSKVCFLMFTLGFRSCNVYSHHWGQQNPTLWSWWWVCKLMFSFFGHTFQKMYARKTTFLIFLVHHCNTLFSSKILNFKWSFCINRKTSAACNFNTLSKVEFSVNS